MSGSCDSRKTLIVINAARPKIELLNMFGVQQNFFCQFIAIVGAVER